MIELLPAITAVLAFFSIGALIAVIALNERVKDVERSALMKDRGLL